MSLNHKKKYVNVVIVLLMSMVGLVSFSQAKGISAEAKKYGYEGHVLLQQGHYKEASVKLGKAQELGDIRAMHTLGLMYIRGDGVKQSYAKALMYFKKSYKAGYINAAYDIGVIYKNGEGVKKDINTAKKYYLIAAKNNYKIAQIELAKIYAYEGNKKQYEYWLKRSKK